MKLFPRSLQARTAVILALAFFVFLSLFFITTYFSIRSSLLARSDGEVRGELEEIASGLRRGFSNDSLTRILSEHRSIGESPLRFVLLKRKVNDFDNLLSSGYIPEYVEEEIEQRPDAPISYTTSEGNMRVISIARAGFIIGASYNTLLIEEAEDSIVEVFAYYLAAGLLVGILGAILLSKYLIGPIGSLANSANAILHRPEKVPARLPVSEKIAEVAALAQSINDLLDTREQALERQRNFAADAAHELRTPLTVLKGEIEVELRMIGTKSPQAELLRSNLEEIERLISTVQDLLELAEIESERNVDSTHSECSLVSAINYAADRLRSLASERGISFELPAGEVIIAAQEKRMTRLIYNLLLNAVQHSDKGSQIVVRVRSAADGNILEIEDHGKGISPDRLTHIFERFYRTGSGVADSRGGAGLGLAIVKSIADHYGFTLSVRSSENAGTTVSVHIPQDAFIK